MLSLDVGFTGVPSGVWHSRHGTNGHGGLPEERPEIYDKTETLARLGTSLRRFSSSTGTATSGRPS